MDLEQVWKAAMGELEITVSKANFSTWFRETFLYHQDKNSITLAVPSDFHLDWIKRNYHADVLKVLQKYFPETKELKYKIALRKQAELPFATTAAMVKIEESDDVPTVPVNCQPDFTFETFVVGNSNRLAYTVSQAVAQNPGNLHNPLFLYGDVGLGKTHLAHAIGNEVAKTKKRKKILYVSCENFTNEFVNAIRTKTIDTFKKKYRSIDVFLVDDIQFLANKEGTQEEFFHTFNTLQQSGKQIVLTSDRPPSALADLEQRLTSRFGGGMVADIKAPNIETRIAIIEQKCREKNYPVPKEVVELIAQKIQSNIRELQGGLNKVVFACQAENEEINLENARKNLADLTSAPTTKKISPEKVIKKVVEFFNINEKEILGRRRMKELVLPRQVIMYLLQTELNLSFTKIGRLLGGKDHTTIIYGCNKIQKELIKDESLQESITEIKERIYGG